MGKQLDKIEVHGFKSIKNLNLDLRQLNVLIGANGAGKTNFVSLFKLLNQIIEKRLQTSVREAGGAETFLFHGSKETSQITIKLRFQDNGYGCRLKPAADDSLFFDYEEADYWGGGYTNPYIEFLGSGHNESNCAEVAAKRRVAQYVLGALRNWKLYHFHDTSDSAKVKKICDINDDFFFRQNAENLAAYLFKLHKGHSHNYELIRQTIQLVAPFFDDFILRPMTENPGKIQLEWREKDSDYPYKAHQLSDGTLRFICLATLLLQPNPPSTIVIDEPELGLHPYAITILASMLRSASANTQVIVSTQSVPLVNQLTPEEVIVVEREGNNSVFKRLSGDQLKDWVEDYGLGDMWEKNLLGGRP